MPNLIDSSGLTTATRQELLDNMSAAMRAIYGLTINLASDSPDGQMLNIFIQAVLDVEDLLVGIYNGFNPDLAQGNVLDQRVAINGIQRQAGTKTITPITLVNSQSVNLYGVDQDVQDVYTVSDAVGTLWQLQTTELGLTAGSHVLNFEAALPGATTPTPNTITTQVTVVLGVTSVNNPTTYTTLGLNEESDAMLKIRRAKSVSLASQGYLKGLIAALENISGVTSAFVYENRTNITDVNGVPGHSIWCILAGSGAAVDIATAIYQKRNAGCGMKGDQYYDILQVDGTTFTVYWDDVVTVNLFIFFTVSSINGVNDPDVNSIRVGLVTDFTPTVYEEVNINGLATDVQAIDSNTLVTNAGFSTGQTQVFTLSGIAASGTFYVNYNGNLSAAINWNDSIGTIQSKIQGITGLSTATVTGSIASQTLTFNLSSVTNVQALLYVENNTLQTSAPAAITFAYNYGLTNTLLPGSRQYQFVVSEDNIVIVALQLLPTTSQVTATETVQFTTYGGYGTYVYSLSINNSGGTIDANTGEYTAGAVTLVQDEVTVTDVLGNTQTAVVNVI